MYNNCCDPEDSFADKLRQQYKDGVMDRVLLQRIIAFIGNKTISAEYLSSLVMPRDLSLSLLVLTKTAHAAKGCSARGIVLCLHEQDGKVIHTTHKKGDCPYVDYKNYKEITNETN